MYSEAIIDQLETDFGTATLLDLPISIFSDAWQNIPESTTTLRRIVCTTHYRRSVEAIRAEVNETKQKIMKKRLRAFSPVAQLHHRKEDTSFSEKIAQQHPLLYVDVDRDDNPGVDMVELKKQVCRLPYVLLCADSVRHGFWAVIRLSDNQTPETLAAHFRYIQKRFLDKFGVTLDSSKGSNPTHLRFVSYDPWPYLNECATVMDKTYTPLPPKPPKPKLTQPNSYISTDNQQQERDRLTRIVRFVEGAGEGERHYKLLKGATTAGGYIATGHLDEQNAIYALETVASEWPMFTKSQKTIKAGIVYGKAKPIYPEEPQYQPTFTARSQPPAPTRQVEEMPVTKDAGISEEPPVRITPLASLITAFDLVEVENDDDIFCPATTTATADPWNVAELEAFFSSVAVPQHLQQFVEGHMGYVRAQNGKRAYLPYYERLEALKGQLQGNATHL